jgi:hypothetical protein
VVDVVGEVVQQFVYEGWVLFLYDLGCLHDFFDHHFLLGFGGSLHELAELLALSIRLLALLFGLALFGFSRRVGLPPILSRFGLTFLLVGLVVIVVVHFDLH